MSYDKPEQKKAEDSASNTVFTNEKPDIAKMVASASPDALEILAGALKGEG